VSFKNGRPDRANYRRFKIKGVAGQDDFASMAEVVRRRYARLKRESRAVTKEDGGLKLEDGGHLSPPLSLPHTGLANSQRGEGGNPSSILHPPSSFPDLIMVDGGRGQLNAACEELKKLGLGKIPVIGLAKEFEEIYLPEKSLPLRLGLDHPAVKLLQRLRDECHRVANSFNAQLRLKKISESVLDEFPGIGERRKAALLKKFGSVSRLRLATLEQIAEVPGFGGKAAGELKQFLAARG
jgi:excinuclease ABC subunit C